jgi:uncharacterized protein (TIGR02217 family)
LPVTFDQTAILNNPVNGGVIDYNAISGGPEHSTLVVTSPFSGVSQRNVNRLDPLHRYTIQTALLKQQQLNDLRAFFVCRDGMARGFLMLDMTEFWFSANGSPYTPTGTPNQFGTGNGVITQFGLYKRYSSGGVVRDRRIVKPVSGTITIYNNAVLQVESANYTLDYTTGIVTFTAAPANGNALTVTGQFFVPVRFATDFFDPGMTDALTGLRLENLPLLEIPTAEFDLTV